MASNNRKMLYPYQPGQGYYNYGYFIPFTQICPPPPPPPPPPPQRDLSVLVSTSICIIGSVLLFLFLTVFLYLYIMQSRRRRISPAAAAPPVSTNRREDENEGIRHGEDLSRYHHAWRITTAGLHRSAIDSITVVGFKKGEGIIDGTDCSVCLSEFEEDESLRLLPKCRHAFHVSCIDTWLLSHKNCPLCRSPVFTTEVRNKNTETNQQTESGSSNGEEESSGSRNVNVLPRSQSDLASHCGTGRLETVRRSFSIGGSSLVKAGGSDDVTGRSRRQFYSSFSANFFSSSRRGRNQDSVLPV